MERFTISKSEKQTIYEIYRACRLCGAGGGYRMPIIQNIIDLDSSEVELRQKIQECLQLEIRPDDRMPPLICELCVDKVNDFYKFLEQTRQTNVKTRTRLGLPIQTAKKGEPESSDCILGVTEPVYVKEKEAPKKSKAGPKSSKAIKKEPDVVQVKVENPSESSSRSSSVSASDRASRTRRSLPASAPTAASAPASVSATAPAPAPAPAPRRKPEKQVKKPDKPPEKPKDKDTLTASQKKMQSARKKELETLLEDNLKFATAAAARAQKRKQEPSPPRAAPLSKRAKPPPVKEPPKEVKEPSPPPSRPGPKSRKPVRREPEPEPEPPVKMYKGKVKTEPVKAKEPAPPPVAPPSPPTAFCVVCEMQFGNGGAYAKHMKMKHTPTFTLLTHACNPCGKWFLTADEASSHHRYHRAPTFPYHCRRCFDDFRTVPLYDEHIEKGLCIQDEQRWKCEECWGMFASEHYRAVHRCPGRDNRPGGKCSKCSKSYATAKYLKKHETQCGQRKAGELIADPDVLRRLKPMQVRVTRCDALVARARGQHVNVAGVKPTYGLAKNYIYPYMKLPPVKTEPLARDSMLAIPLTLKQEDAIEYTHWDSDDSDTEIIKEVPTLSVLAIKKLFSKDLLGKVPRRRKKVKNEAFDNDNEFEVSDINDIISSLDAGNSSVDRNALTAKIKDIIGCLDDSEADVNFDDKIPINEDEREVNASNEVVGKESERTEEIETINEDGREVNASNEVVGKESEGTEEIEKSNDGKDIVANSEMNEEDVLSRNNGNDIVCNESENKSSDSNDAVWNGPENNTSNDVSNDSENNKDIVNSNDGNDIVCNENNASASNESENNEEIVNNNDSNDIENNESANNESENNEEIVVNSNDGNHVEESNKIDESTNEKIESSETNLDSDNREESSNIDVSISKEPDVVLENHSNMLENENQEVNRVVESETINENDKLDRIEDETSKDFVKDIDVSLQMEETKKPDIPNGNHSLDDSMEIDKSNMNELKIAEEKHTKESPIKHSIENLIGETDRNPNPDKYISEVISSIEDIIMNNPRNEEKSDENNEINDNSLMEALDEQIGEKRLSDQDKITLEDLLPKDNIHEELENISDDDFNFDA